MRKIICFISAFLVITLSSCYKSCEHIWKNATCEEPKTCSVCGKQEGQPLEHIWEDATCAKPKTCSVCSKREGSTLPHSYGSDGICINCESTKEYGNSYGYFDKSELFNMAKDAVEDYAYPTYVYDYSSISDVQIEKVTDDRLLLGEDSFSVVASASFSSNGAITTRIFVVVVEPHTSTSYVLKDIYIN